MATASASPAEDRNGLELNGHVSPADSQPDATNATKSTTPDDAPAQDSLKSTDASNKDAFASNRSVSAMTPPNVDSVASADATAEDKPAPSADAGDTEMVDAPDDAAKPPSPPADPVASKSEPAAEVKAEAAETTEASSKPASSPGPVADDSKASVKAEPAGEAKPAADSDETKADDAAAKADKGAEGGGDKPAASKDAPPATGDTVTPTTSMSQMAIDGSQDTAAAPLSVDTSMTDAPSQSSAKIAREREEDEEDEPMAKRVRTSGEQAAESTPSKPPAATPDAMVVDTPAPASATGSAAEPQTMPDGSTVAPSDPGFLNDRSLDNSPITTWQNRQIRKALGLVKKTKDGQHFRQSVQTLWPTVWDQYRQLIEHPMDISLIESNLRSGHYSTLGQLREDVELLQKNATTFNGANHDVTAWAKNTVGQIFWRMSQIPVDEPAKPAKQEPKQMPTRHPEPRNPPPPKPKKESRPAAAAPADKASDAPIYALLPSGLPNIRRDSTKNDGDRPKRPIHPPKNKDIGFQPKTTKKKPELKFCEEVMKEVKAGKHWQHNQWFMEPVDPVALNIPTYHSIVKQPMDLGTMNEKLQSGQYETAKDFKYDFNLIVKNCVKFNGEDHAVTNAAKDLEKIFDKKWSEKASWLSKHAQAAAPPASVTSPRGGQRDESEDEDASEAEPEQPDSTAGEIVEVQRAIEALTTRLKKEQSEVDKKLFSANPDMSDIDMHRGIITHLQNQMVEKRQLLTKLESKKGTQPKATKKKTTSGAGASSNSASKKAGGGSGSTKKSAGAGAPVKKPSKKKLNDEEKEIVSEAIARLESGPLDKAIAIIKKDTGLKTEDDELELDMDQLSDEALVKLFELVIKAFPYYKDQLKKNEPAPAPAPSHSSSAMKSSKPKKNKPMGKAEQERKLEQLRELKNSYKRPGSGSQEPLPSVEKHDGSMAGGHHHDDSDDASSSEEE